MKAAIGQVPTPKSAPATHGVPPGRASVTDKKAWAGTSPPGNRAMCPGGGGPIADGDKTSADSLPSGVRMPFSPTPVEGILPGGAGAVFQVPAPE